jgi:maleylacetoacetate isomerase
MLHSTDSQVVCDVFTFVEVENLKMTSLVLYNYWMSSSSWRVRIALHLKGIEYKYVSIEDVDPKKWKEINPFLQVPALEVNGSEIITQSQAIIQYLEDAFPSTVRILPDDPLSRAQVRMISDAIVSGIQPLQNPPIVDLIEGIEEGAGKVFAKNTIITRFEALEIMLAKTAGVYSVGDKITMADAVLYPQVYNAITRYEVDVVQYFPLLSRIFQVLEKIPCFDETQPKKQPDAPRP